MRLHPRYAYLFIVALAGCASAPEPSEQLQVSEQALAQARAVGVSEDDADFRLATGKMAQARAAIADRSFKLARTLAEQAELDARVAEARLLTQKSQDQLAASNVRIDRLRKQLQEGQ